MALRGMLTQNIDRKEAEDYSANTDERKDYYEHRFTPSDGIADGPVPSSVAGSLPR